MTDAARPRPRARWSFPIGSIAGIQIRVHATFFLLVALFAFAGTASEGPGLAASLAWLAAIFACVVLHELAHCLVGRRHGLVVHEIDLLPIGGVSRLETYPETARDEFAMAIAGPAASVALAATAALVTVAASQALYPIDLARGPFLARLAWLNLLLAAFNMLPAFPLDGGRVFRSLLERRYDLSRATHIAASTGRWLALLLIAGGMIWNVWLAIIGVFVYLGANAEEAATLIHVRLAGRQVRDAMLVMPTTIDAKVRVEELRQLVRRNGQGTFPVVCANRYVGVINVAAIERAPTTSCAGDIADSTVMTLAPEDDLEHDIPALATARTHAVPVIEGGRVVGLLRLDEVNRLVAGTDPGSSTARSE